MGWCWALAVAIVVAVQVNELTGLQHEDGTNFLKSNKVTTLADMVEMEPIHRSRRSVTLSDAEKTKLVDKHNALRQRQGASDMKQMKWSSYLASMAADWADGCQWKHGQPSRDKKTMPFKSVGQNLYMMSSKNLNLVQAVQAWYNEISVYDYDTLTCSGPMCGHYTQVVWADSMELGCAVAYCDPMYNSRFKAATYLVCNYGPAGNYMGRKPFTKGDVCTKCGSDKGWCDSGLCCEDCKGSDNCECNVQCQNCGEVDTKTCTCKCPKGWNGDYCNEECGNYHQYCTKGWPKSWCDKEHPYVLSYCPLKCGLCEKPDPTVTCDPSAKTTTTTKKPTTTTTTTTTITTTPAPTTTTKTVKPTTTTPSTGVDSCVKHECLHRGVLYKNKGGYSCKCKSKWQGITCQTRRKSRTVGIKSTVDYPMGEWNARWKGLRRKLMKKINKYCNKHVKDCCPDATTDSSDVDYNFLTKASQVKLAGGYPWTCRNKDVVYQAYARAFSNNELCAAYKGSRKRRTVDAAIDIPTEFDMQDIDIMQMEDLD